MNLLFLIVTIVSFNTCSEALDVNFLYCEYDYCQCAPGRNVAKRAIQTSWEPIFTQILLTGSCSSQRPWGTQYCLKYVEDQIKYCINAAYEDYVSINHICYNNDYNGDCLVLWRNIIRWLMWVSSMVNCQCNKVIYSPYALRHPDWYGSFGAGGNPKTTITMNPYIYGLGDYISNVESSNYFLIEYHNGVFHNVTYNMTINNNTFIPELFNKNYTNTSGDFLMMNSSQLIEMGNPMTLIINTSYVTTEMFKFNVFKNYSGFGKYAFTVFNSYGPALVKECHTTYVIVSVYSSLYNVTLNSTKFYVDEGGFTGYLCCGLYTRADNVSFQCSKTPFNSQSTQPTPSPTPTPTAQNSPPTISPSVDGINTPSPTSSIISTSIPMGTQHSGVTPIQVSFISLVMIVVSIMN